MACPRIDPADRRTRTIGVRVTAAEAADLPRPDLIVWLRRYIRRHPFPITPPSA